MVSGGVFFTVSLTVVSTGGGGGGDTLLVSTVVLSDDPDTFFVELHADVANIIEPTKARLKIVFLMIIFF